jgi:hypothetical protein
MFSSINRRKGKRELYAARPAVPFFNSQVNSDAFMPQKQGRKKEKERTGKKKKGGTPEWRRQRKKS